MHFHMSQYTCNISSCNRGRQFIARKVRREGSFINNIGKLNTVIRALNGIFYFIFGEIDEDCKLVQMFSF
jgi:hypothetical protein